MTGNHDTPRALDPHRTALIMIEFQREWLDPEIGKLGQLMQDQDAFQASIPKAKRLLGAARDAGMNIVHVPCLFRPGYPEIAGGLAQGLFGAIPRFGTWTGEGRPFAEGFTPLPEEFVVTGRVGASAFAHSDLDVFLRTNRITRLLLAGYALHVCVESTLRQAHDLGYTVGVVEDACAAFTAAQRRHVLEDVVHHFGDVLPMERVLGLLATSLPIAVA